MKKDVGIECSHSPKLQPVEIIILAAFGGLLHFACDALRGPSTDWARLGIGGPMREVGSPGLSVSRRDASSQSRRRVQVGDAQFGIARRIVAAVDEDVVLCARQGV